MKRSIIRSICITLIFSIVFSLTAMCFSFSASASTALKSSRELLGEYITELYLKGPAVSSSVRDNLIEKGLDKDGLLEKRAEFDLRLCSSDINDNYFFTDKEEFLDLFGEKDFVLLDGVYTWYAGVPEARKAGVSLPQSNANDPLIKINLSTALNFAIDVYGFSEEDSLDLFSDKFDSSRKELVSFAIDCIYKIITALEDQIGTGSSKPRIYKKEYLETFTTEESGLYPYFDVRFKNNDPVMTGYYDTDAYKEKKYDYDSLKESIETNALLSVFQTAYANHKAQKDGGVLYYDFLTTYENARISYYELCSAVLKTEAKNTNIDEKAKAYLKLKDLGRLFAEYILPYADAYSAELNLITINYTTIKTLIHFVSDNPYFLNSISLSAMNDLIENFTQSLSKLAPLPEYTVNSQIFATNSIISSKLDSYIDNFEGVIGDKNEQLYAEMKELSDKLSTVSPNGITVYAPVSSFYISNEEKIESDPFTLEIVPSTPFYLGLIKQTRILCNEFNKNIESSLPKVPTDVEQETAKIKEVINNYSFILGINEPIICDTTGEILPVNTTDSAKALLKAVLKDEWDAEKINDNKLFEFEVIFNAAVEYYAYKNNISFNFLNSEKTSVLASFRTFLDDSKVMYEVLTDAIKMIEKDISIYAYSLEYIAADTAKVWRLFNDASTGTYRITSTATTSDGTDPANPHNYKSNAVLSMTDALNGLIFSIKNLGTTAGSTATMFVSEKRFDLAVKSLLSEYGKDCLNDYKYDLANVTSQYFGKEDLAYAMYKTLIENKGITLNKYIVVDSNGQVSISELVYKYFAFTVSAVSKDYSRPNNLYSFDGNRIMTNLITPLDVILKNRATYIGYYARDKAEEIENDMNEAQLLVSSVNDQTKTVGHEITVGEAEALLAKLSEVNFSLSNYSLSYIASYKASVLDAIMDKAMSKTIDQTNTTPYYKLICDRFQNAYYNASNVSYDKTIPISEIDEAAKILTQTFNTLEEYERAMAGTLLTVKDLETKISEAEHLLARYDITESNKNITELRSALDLAKKDYSEKLSTFTANELKLAIRTLDSAIKLAEDSLMIGSAMKSEIAKITAAVKNSSDYTTDSWANYTSALSKANIAAASTTEKVSVCINLIEELKATILSLKTPEIESDNSQTEPEETPDTPVQEDSSNETTDNSTDEFYIQANEVYINSVSELAAYVLSSSANEEKIAVWTASLESLKKSIEERQDQSTILANIVAIQLAKDLQIENPETNDD